MKGAGKMGERDGKTGRERAEGALRESEERYRAVVEDQTELICRSSPDLTLTFVNEAYCRYFGKGREELVGRSYLPFIVEEDREKLVERLARLGPENPTEEVEHRALSPEEPGGRSAGNTGSTGRSSTRRATTSGTSPWDAT